MNVGQSTQAAPKNATPLRVIAYIDGYNLYYGIREADLRHLLWLDITKMVTSVLKDHQELVATKYFTSRASRPPETVKRQTTYLEALQTLSDVVVIEGRHDGEQELCDHCGTPSIYNNEKMTDVNIAVEILKDAYADRFDTALLVTADSDQVPTIRAIRQLWGKTKKVICVFPPNRISNQLKSESNGYTYITENTLRQCQLPEIVKKSSSILLARPEKWQPKEADPLKLPPGIPPPPTVSPHSA